MTNYYIACSVRSREKNVISLFANIKFVAPNVSLVWKLAILYEADTTNIVERNALINNLNGLEYKIC